MVDVPLRSSTRWLAFAAALAAVAFGLLTAGLLRPAAFVGVPAALAVAAAGGKLSHAVTDVAGQARLDYPFGLEERGRRLAYTALISALGIGGFALASSFVRGALGDTGLILVGAAALLGPPMVVMMLVWAVDGISLFSGHAAPGDPLIGAAGSLGLALVLALLTATTQFQADFALLAAFGGLVPSAFVLWSLVGLDRALDTAGPVG